MDYTRHSSQPATVDLVRADLAEMWTIDGLELQSPKRSSSASNASDMLDLEFLPTPGCRPSKAKKKDPLPDMLADILELSPNPKAACHEKGVSNTKQRGIGSDTPSEDQMQGQDAPSRLSIAANHPSNQSDPSGKMAAQSTSKKGSAKAPQQTKRPLARAGPATAQAKTKARKRDHDLFELSDSTDSEGVVSGRKKQQVRRVSPGKPPVRRAQGAHTVNKQESAGSGVRGKSTRVPKKLAKLHAPEQANDEAGPAYSGTLLRAGQQVALNSALDLADEPAVAKSSSHQKPRTRLPASTVHGAVNSGLTSSTPPNRSPIVERMNEPILPPRSEALDAVAVCHKRTEKENEAPRLTSPLFVEQDGESMNAIDGPDISGTVDPGLATTPSWTMPLKRAPTPIRFNPPLSFQPQAPANQAEIHELGDNTCQLPAGIREAFLSDEQPAMGSPSPAPELLPGANNGASDPEEVWKQAVEDDTPPAVLHRIITLLHRSLKPREEVVRDIAVEYQENALRLLDNLSARHIQERSGTLNALRNASRGAFSTFSGAGSDMAILTAGLRDMDVTNTAETLKCPVFAQKLDDAARLCQAAVGHYTGHPDSTASGDGFVWDGEGRSEILGDLAESYRLQLFEATQRPDAQALENCDKVATQVDEFIKCCLRSEPKKVCLAGAKRPGKPARTADRALEVFLDRAIGTLQESSNKEESPESVVHVASEGSDMSSFGFRI
ncbi:uncharacterized protein THITE_46484 [Thermothielavioides terrestris NRRL 8126]|uniref:Uncharacterized protein n=1 Tax=Thermothielavioides terrestris (strain ATCC 38088 / NRRL 8126) TaxID=578455 RepID=G2RCZ9_THETT|nr:uncharacterized protein THITE_46484 [Thermothielavioides terrestris NRRL 8126]AEO70692.1 hypothetical protein THITE_46484 [Thermothielavioides terrestris NRRL 8126]